MALILNIVAVRKKLNSAAKNKANFFYGSALLRFNQAKQELIKDFINHEVTKELDESKVSDRDSKLVSDGSLRAALGIPEGQDVVQEMLEFLDDEKNLKMDKKENVKITENQSKVYFRWRVIYPSKTTIYEEKKFELEWTSRTWIEIIEEGLSNLTHFIMAENEQIAGRFADADSRSGWGLQNKKANTGRTFTPQPYISTLIEEFAEKFQ